MLLMVTALLLLSKSLIQTSQILTPTSNLSSCWSTSFYHDLNSGKLFVFFILSLSINPILDSLTPTSFRFYDLSFQSLYWQFLHLLLVLCPFSTSLSGKTLFLYKMIHLPYLCLTPGNWVPLEQITWRTNWHHNKWCSCASTVPWILPGNSIAGFYSTLTHTLHIY